MAMRKECEAASWWWTQQLNGSIAPPLTKEQLASFQKSLADVLEDKYTSHWYIEDPERGSAFRSIIHDNRTVDHVLLEAASKSKIPNLKSRLPADVIMWVDPLQIQVQYSHSPRRHLIYGKQGAHDHLMDPSVLRGVAMFNTGLAANGRPMHHHHVKSIVDDEQQRQAQTVNM